MFKIKGGTLESCTHLCALLANVYYAHRIDDHYNDRFIWLNSKVICT